MDSPLRATTTHHINEVFLKRERERERERETVSEGVSEHRRYIIRHSTTTTTTTTFCSMYIGGDYEMKRKHDLAHCVVACCYMHCINIVVSFVVLLHANATKQILLFNFLRRVRYNSSSYDDVSATILMIMQPVLPSTTRPPIIIKMLKLTVCDLTKFRKVDTEFLGYEWQMPTTETVNYAEAMSIFVE